MWFEQFKNGMESRRVTFNGRTFKAIRVKAANGQPARSQFTAVFPSADSVYPRICPSFAPCPG
jgi:hypothetical protein